MAKSKKSLDKSFDKSFVSAFDKNTAQKPPRKMSDKEKNSRNFSRYFGMPKKSQKALPSGSSNKALAKRTSKDLSPVDKLASALSKLPKEDFDLLVSHISAASQNSDFSVKAGPSRANGFEKFKKSPTEPDTVRMLPGASPGPKQLAKYVSPKSVGGGPIEPEGGMSLTKRLGIGAGIGLVGGALGGALLPQERDEGPDPYATMFRDMARLKDLERVRTLNEMKLAASMPQKYMELAAGQKLAPGDVVIGGKPNREVIQSALDRMMGR